MSEWQPIETAPKDITVLATDGTALYLVLWQDGEWVDIGDGSGWTDDVEPLSHWMPLPALPRLEPDRNDRNEREQTGLKGAGQG